MSNALLKGRAKGKRRGKGKATRTPNPNPTPILTLDPKHTNPRAATLAQAFSLWLMDMASLSPSYRERTEFKAVYREYYQRFTNDIRMALGRGL
jgi:hypothetical protein